VHGAASGGFAIGCGQRDDADSPSVTMGWNGNPPTDSFWSITASVGGIVTGASPRAIEDGARACYKDAKTKLAGKKNAESDMVRDAISYRCGLMTGDTEPRGTFYVTIVKLKPAD
jgi:hypothetical protein